MFVDTGALDEAGDYRLTVDIDEEASEAVVNDVRTAGIELGTMDDAVFEFEINFDFDSPRVKEVSRGQYRLG